ncbi:DHA2 family efflux MFS transporter permease subunit [Pokkaliibacter plantistimulans]|nr:DHA2 family efflux MFS transporter permease subunit [Pokkaliibacter plantistimulans]
MSSAAPIPPSQWPMRKRVFAFACMCLGFFIASLDIQIVAASLKEVGGALSAGQDETAWVQTSYLIAEIIVIPLSGFLSRVMSTRWLFAFSAGGFTLTSLLCGLAWNIDSMIAFRALQGFLGGSMIPMVFTTAFAFFPGRQAVVAASTIGALASMAPTLGPTIGGWITEHYSWHWLFFINLLPGLFITVVVPMVLKVDEADWGLLKVADYPGIALMATFLGSLQYVLEEGARWNWLDDQTIALCFWVAIGSGVAFVWRSLSYRHPVVDLRALGQRQFALGCLFSFVTGMGIFAAVYMTPVFLGYVRGYNAWQIGMAIFTTGLFQLLAIPLYGIAARHIDLRWLLMLGLALFALSLWSYTPLTSQWGGDELLLPQALRGIGQQFAVAPTVTLTLGSLPPARLRQASGLFNLMRNLGGAIGIALCGTLLNSRTNLHFERLAENLNAARQPAMDFISELSTQLQTQFSDAGAATAVTLRQLFGMTYRQAQVMSFADTFWVLAGCFGLVLLLVPLMRQPAAAAAMAAREAH